jgi:hypothetical protein
MMEQTKWMHEEYLKLHVEQKMEKMKEMFGFKTMA